MQQLETKAAVIGQISCQSFLRTNQRAYRGLSGSAPHWARVRKINRGGKAHVYGADIAAAAGKAVCFLSVFPERTRYIN